MKTLTFSSVSGMLPLALLVFCLQSEVLAGMYGEHKHIGDSAFAQVVGSIPNASSDFSGVWTDSLVKGVVVHWFEKLSREDGTPEFVTYGDLCGLSADHVESPLRLYEEIRNDFSPLRVIVLEQHKSLGRYLAGAPDVQVALEDPSLLGMVIDDKSHFYDYKKSFKEHLEDFDIRVLDSLIALTSEPINTKELYNVTSLNKYVILHGFAIYTAQVAARTRNRDLYRLAIYINGYADHFLQDAFSSGHRTVHRSYLGSFLSNKFMHDFFGARGLAAINMEGQRWLSYGDGQYNRPTWKNLNGAGRRQSDNMSLAIRCCSTSVAEVICASRTAPESTVVDTLRRWPKSDSAYYHFFLQRFRALRYVPVPFQENNPDEKDLKADTALNQFFEARLNEPGFDSVAFSRFNDAQRMKYLDLRPDYIRAPSELVTQVHHHKSIALSLIYSRFSYSFDRADLPNYTFGYSVSLKGVANNISYDNLTFEHLHKVDWWMDISITHLMVRNNEEKGTEFKFGLNNCIDIYRGGRCLVELGILNELGWFSPGEKVFRWEPSFELAIGPMAHEWGVKIRAREMRAADNHALDLGIVWETNQTIDCVVDFFDRLFLGIL
jgi:hypothetical protein